MQQRKGNDWKLGSIGTGEGKNPRVWVIEVGETLDGRSGESGRVAKEFNYVGRRQG